MFVRAARGRDEALAIVTVLEGNPYIPAFVLEEMGRPYAHTLDVEVLVCGPHERQPRTIIPVILMTDRGAQEAWDHYLLPPIVPDRRPPFTPADILALRREGPGATCWTLGPEFDADDEANLRPTVHIMTREPHLDYEVTLSAIARVFGESAFTENPGDEYRLVMAEEPWDAELATAWVLRDVFTTAAHDARNRANFLELRAQADRIEREMILPARMKLQDTRYARWVNFRRTLDEDAEQFGEGVPRQPGRPRAPESLLVDRITRGTDDRAFYLRIDDPEAELELLNDVYDDAVMLGLDIGRARAWFLRMASWEVPAIT